MATTAERTERVGFGMGTGPSSEDTWSHAAISNQDDDGDDADYEDRQKHTSKFRGSARNSTSGEPLEGGQSRNQSSDRLRQKSSERLRQQSQSRERPRVKRKTSRGAVTVMDDAIDEEDENNWIHRDKLAQIESKELAQMGFRVSRSASRSRSRKAASVRTDAPDFDLDDMPSLPVDSNRSTMTQALDGTNGHPRTPTMPSSPAEESAHKRSRSRGNSSVSRSRNVSVSKPGENGASSSPSTSSAQKSKKPQSRQASVDQSNHRGGSRKPSISERPKTRDGQRPPSRPEGDPPWLNNAYKPDPRLPPDQQMLPTHARRMAEMQAQAERGVQERAADGGSTENNEYMLLEDSGGSDAETKSSPVKPANNFGSSTTTTKVTIIQNEDDHPQRGSSLHNSPNPEQANAQWPLAQPATHQSKPSNGIASVQQQQPQTYPTPPQQQQPQWENPRSAPSPTKNSPRSPQNTTFSNNGSLNGSRVTSPHPPIMSNQAEYHGGYNLMPSVKGASSVSQQPPPTEVEKKRESRLSQRSPNIGSLSRSEFDANMASAPVNQPVRLQPEPDEKAQAKDKGCLGCCVVM